MQFDLFTFLASLFNFIVLVVALRLLLFKRVTAAMDEREAKISSSWEEAESKSEEAESKIAEYERRLDEAEEERSRLMEDAREHAEAQKKRLLEKAREEVEERRQSWTESLAKQREAVTRQLSEQVAHATIKSSQEVIHSLVGVSLQEAIVDRLIERIGEDEEARSAIRGSEVRLASASELPAELQSRTEQRLRSEMGAKAVQFATDPELLAGVRIEANEYELSFSARSSFSDVEQRIGQIVTAASGGDGE